MSHRLTSKDILALGFMTFALFVGAGNIIFPPMVGLQSGEHVWIAALGFLITAVGLPVITVIALARVGGGIDALSSPIGRGAGLLLATVCYLAVGPLFATPRTATVSFEVGIAPLTGDGAMPLFIYSLVYFALVIGISLYPGRLLDTVGHVLAPLKIVALGVLGIAALLWPAGAPIPATAAYQSVPFSSGFVNGYLTMDTLGALVFGIVIVNAARSRGVKDAGLLTRYTILAGLIAGVGLTLVYLSLFKLGSGSGALVPDATNGAVILHAYVQNTFGGTGSFFGGADLHRLYGDRGRPDLRLRRVLRAIPAVLVQDAGVYLGSVLDGGVQPRPEPPDPDLHSGADRDLPAVHRAGGAELHPALVAQRAAHHRAGDACQPVVWYP